MNINGFADNTLIRVEPWNDRFHGFRSESLYIERLEVGDLVLSRCEHTGEISYKPVTKLYSYGYAQVVAIAGDHGPEYYEKYGSKASTGILTTLNCPFWVHGKQWTKVSELCPGDEFFTFNGVRAAFKVKSLNVFEAEIYNLEVADFHTYFVESAGIWVHDSHRIASADTSCKATA